MQNGRLINTRLSLILKVVQKSLQSLKITQVQLAPQLRQLEKVTPLQDGIVKCHKLCQQNRSH